MGKIVGKVLVSLSCFFATLNADIRLHIQTMDGKPLKQAGIGQPFMLEVIRQGTSSQLSTPDIKGLEPFVVKNSGLQMRTTNGISTVKYQYVMRSDSVGTFTIGPAILQVGNERLYSNQITFAVNAEQHAQQQSVTPKKSKESVFMRLTLDKQHVVMGEKVEGAIRFYSADGSILFHDLHAPDFTTLGLDVFEQGRPEQGVEQINGHSYHYAQWSWHAYPTKEGELVVPAYWAEYSTNEGRGGLFSQFFNRVLKRVYSNAATLMVNALPDQSKKVDAVGHYTQFTTKIEPSAIRKGDAMVLSLELIGEGDIEHLSAPIIKHIPAGLRIYESKSMLIDDIPDKRYLKKRFEYVVQALQAGDFEIPTQHFFYFDTKERQYATLSTGQLFVTVLPEPHEQVSPNDDRVEDTHEVIQDNCEDDIGPLALYGPWYDTGQRYYIPQFLFMLLFCAPLMWWFMALILYPFGIRDYCRWYYGHKQITYKRALKRLRHIAHKKDYAAVYSFFLTYFSQRWAVPVKQLDQQYCEKILKNAFSEDELLSWHQFFNQVMQAAFFRNQPTANDGLSLFEQAESWLALFKERL